MTRWLLPCFATLALAAACGSSNDSGLGGSGGSTSGGSGNSGGSSSGGSNSGGSGNSGGSLNLTGGSSGTGAGGGSGGSDFDGGCTGTSASADVVPPIIMLVIDTSGSMNDGVGGGQTKWTATRGAMIGAVQAMPDTNYLGVLFYPDTPGAFGPCIETNPDFPVGPLTPNRRQTFEQTMNGQNCTGGTPTHDAFVAGADTLAGINQPNRYVVLITDGIPTYARNCNGDGQTQISPQQADAMVNDVAARSAAGIHTYIIGSPGSEAARNTLSRMASAGGTAAPGCSDNGPTYCHFDMTTSSNFTQALNDALAAISGATLSCTFTIPAPPNGQTLDPTKVNVTYTPSGGSGQTIGQDQTGTCASGWTYSPDGKQIILCGSTCDQVKADPTGKVDIVFGCGTIPA